MPSNKPPRDQVNALRVKLRAAADKTDMTYTEIGIAMGMDLESARRVVSRLLSPNIDYDPRLSTLVAFAQAIKQPLAELLRH